MSPDLYVASICQRLQDGEFECKEKPYDAYSLKAGDEELIVTEGGDGRIWLLYKEDGEDKLIAEPPIHISKAPFGKFFLWLTDGAWPKGPQTPKELENESLRIALVRLYKLVEKRCQ